jgi:hypothetical protein
MYDQLLGWMHRKLRQNSNDVFKEFNNGGGTFILICLLSALRFCSSKKNSHSIGKWAFLIQKRNENSLFMLIAFQIL